MSRVEVARRRLEGSGIVVIFMTCREATRLVSESLDRELPWHERFGLRLHLIYCRACARYKRQLSFVRRAVRRFVEGVESGTIFDMSTSLSDDARNRLKQSLKDASDE